MSAPRRLVLFDLDGTLVDSSSAIWSSVCAAVARLGLTEPTAEQLRALIGPPLQDGFAEILGLGPTDVDRALRAYRAHSAAVANPPVTVYDGIPQLLALLSGEGVTLAVATSKPEPLARRVLEAAGLLDFFASVHGATFDGAVRHKHQIVELALADHPGARDPVLVGDRAQDVVGAASNGLPCIGAGWGLAEAGELEAAGAALVVATPAEVPAALEATCPVGDSRDSAAPCDRRHRGATPRGQLRGA